MLHVSRALMLGGVSLGAVLGVAPRVEAAFLTNPTITANATQFNASFPASNVFNGNELQYASQTLGANTFIDFDFGAPTAIDALDIINRPGTADAVTSFNLIFSDDATFDGSDPIVTINQNYAGVGSTSYLGTLTSFAPQTARYVRWDVTGVSGGANNSGAAEMKFRSAGALTRLAPGAVTVIASATPFNATYDKSNASDGALGNATNGDYSSASLGVATFLDFDLGSEQAIGGFELVQRLFAGDRATSFDLLFSNDPTFTTLVDTRSYGDSSMFVSDEFEAVNARYVRYDVTGASGNNIGAQEMSFLVEAPEPGSTAMLVVGFAGILMGRRRRAVAK